MAGKRGGKRIIAGLSGAQAAAGDLLRARSNEPVDDTVDEVLVAAATSVFAAFETFYKGRRTYDEGHPALDRFFTQLEDKLRTALSRFEEISVTVTSKGLELDGRAVYSADRPDQNTWFPLYRDGIRELTLSHGIDRDQISRFCRALATLATIKPGAADDDGEDDAVTMLWDLALEHIDYVAIDTFVDGAGPDDEQRVQKIREIVTISMMKELVVPADSPASRDLEIARRLKSVALTKADLTFLVRDNLAALDELPARLREAQGDLYTVDHGTREALARGMGTDPELFEKLLQAIVQALIADDSRDHVEVLCSRIDRAFTGLVVDGNFVRATRLRRQVIPLAGATPDAELVAHIDRAMSAGPALAAIVTALVQCADDKLAEVTELIEVMPHGSVHALIQGFGKVEQRRRRRLVCDIVSAWGAPAVEAVVAALADSSEEVALDLVYLLRRIGSESSVALERASHHPAPAVRASALRLYVETASLATIAPRIKTALRDPDATVRAAALEIVVSRRPEGALRWIKDSINTEDFTSLELGEKKRLCVAYAAVGGPAVAPELRARLDQRNLLMRSAVDEDRAAAASALGMLRDEDSRATLGKLAHATLARASLKTACVEALAELDAEPPVVAVQAPAPIAPGLPAVTFRTAAPAGARSVDGFGATALPRAEPPALRPSSAAPPAARAPSPVVATPVRPTTRPDPRSASGARPTDDGVAVSKPRSVKPGDQKGRKPDG